MQASLGAGTKTAVLAAALITIASGSTTDPSHEAKSHLQSVVFVEKIYRSSSDVQSNVVCGLPLQPKSDKAMACFEWNLFSHHLRKQTIQKELLFDMDPETYMIETHAT